MREGWERRGSQGEVRTLKPLTSWAFCSKTTYISLIIFFLLLKEEKHLPPRAAVILKTTLQVTYLAWCWMYREGSQAATLMTVTRKLFYEVYGEVGSWAGGGGQWGWRLLKVILVTLKIPPCYFGLRAFKWCVLSCPTGTLPRKLIKQSRMCCNEWFASKDICKDEWERILS